MDVRSGQEDAQQFLVTWGLSEDDEFNDRDVDHYEVYRRVVGFSARTKIADVQAGVQTYTDILSESLPQGSTVVYDVVAVDTAGLRSSPSGWFAPGDFNLDGDVDQDDLVVLRACTSGATITYASECTDADFDADNDVDLDDFGIFQRCLSGSDRVADPSCATEP